MTNLTLRQASTADSDFAYRVRSVAFKQYVEKTSGWDDVKQRQLHDERFRVQDFRIINLAGTDVGIMALGVAPDCVKVNQLLLLPEHQGREIGRRCMLLIMAQARQLGLPIRLRVMKVNPRALAFYERLGFMRVGQTDTHDLMAWTHNNSLQPARCARG
jgi:ribosomal protein S18 acetylase RimI-like enzyme